MEHQSHGKEKIKRKRKDLVNYTKKNPKHNRAEESFQMGGNESEDNQEWSNPNERIHNNMKEKESSIVGNPILQYTSK